MFGRFHRCRSRRPPPLPSGATGSGVLPKNSSSPRRRASLSFWPSEYDDHACSPTREYSWRIQIWQSAMYLRREATRGVTGRFFQRRSEALSAEECPLQVICERFTEWMRLGGSQRAGRGDGAQGEMVEGTAAYISARRCTDSAPTFVILSIVLATPWRVTVSYIIADVNERSSETSLHGNSGSNGRALSRSGTSRRRRKTTGSLYVNVAPHCDHPQSERARGSEQSERRASGERARKLSRASAGGGQQEGVGGGGGAMHSACHVEEHARSNMAGAHHRILPTRSRSALRGHRRTGGPAARSSCGPSASGACASGHCCRSSRCSHRDNCRARALRASTSPPWCRN